jgi:hypothetical protein
MPVTITNRSNQLLILHLNDGQAIYLAPGESSRPLDEMQVGGNEKMAKLTRDNLVSIEAKKAGRASDGAEKDATPKAVSRGARPTQGDAPSTGRLKEPGRPR